MRTFFTILFFIFLISYLFRILAPYIFSWFLKRVEKKFTNQYNSTTNQRKTKKEGQVSINQTEKKEKKVDKNVGDYIDFEEEN
jgi:hypothetical protein